jgi:hypothetical protein
VGVPSAAAPVQRARRVPLARELLLLVVLAALITAVVKDFAVEAFRSTSRMRRQRTRIFRWPGARLGGNE